MKMTILEENSLALVKFSKNLFYQLNPIHQLKMRDEFLQNYATFTMSLSHTNIGVVDEQVDLFAIYDAVTRRGYIFFEIKIITTLNYSIFVVIAYSSLFFFR